MLNHSTAGESVIRNGDVRRVLRNIGYERERKRTGSGLQSKWRGAAIDRVRDEERVCVSV